MYPVRISSALSLSQINTLKNQDNEWQRGYPALSHCCSSGKADVILDCTNRQSLATIISCIYLLGISQSVQNCSELVLFLD